MSSTPSSGVTSADRQKEGGLHQEATDGQSETAEMEAKQDETSVIGWDGTFELDQTANTCIVNNTVVSDPSVSRFSSEAGLSSTASSGVTSADR